MRAKSPRTAASIAGRQRRYPGWNVHHKPDSAVPKQVLLPGRTNPLRQTQGPEGGGAQRESRSSHQADWSVTVALIGGSPVKKRQIWERNRGCEEIHPRTISAGRWSLAHCPSHEKKIRALATLVQSSRV